MQVNMCEMESLDSDNRKLDECLNNFEDAVKREKCYLLAIFCEHKLSSWVWFESSSIVQSNHHVISSL